MKKKLLSIYFLGIVLSNLSAQTSNLDWTRAPNSYVFDTDYARTNNKGGIEIPVKKAYRIWADPNWYLNQAIPSGTLSSTIYWQDVPGLIKSATIVPGATPEDAVIRVMVDRSKGEGNAVISFKVNDTIYWSWHVWVTDDPSKTPTIYDKGIEKDIAGNDAAIQYLDRNLGATNASFLGNDGHKSGGLLYQWGRKDPFPGFIYKDGSWYEVSGDVGNIRGDDGHNTGANGVAYAKVLMQKFRAYDNVGDNIKDAIKNPMTFINDPQKPWFSNTIQPQSGYRWNLWSDNRNGQDGGSPYDTSGNTQKIKLKSPYDPCPNGWRVPSFMGNIAVDNTASPWGRHGGSNDDGTTNKTISNSIPQSPPAPYDGIKIYPGLGVDFSQTTWANGIINRRGLGQFPLNGDYEYYASNVNKSVFQDNGSEMNIRSATLAGLSGADGNIVADRSMVITSDFGRNLDHNANYGLNEIRTHWSYNLVNMGVAVRCMKDPDNNLVVNSSTYDFPTYYVNATDFDYTKGLNDPNSYLVPLSSEEKTVLIPINKPFSVYNQYLTDHKTLPTDNLKTNILWTSNKNLISKVDFVRSPDCNTSTDAPYDCQKISVKINPNQFGNAVIVLKRDGGQSTRKGVVYWSWHIWVPKDNPTTSTITYQTEDILTDNSTGYFVNPTHSGVAPLKTTFMDRNLGAIEAFPTVSDPSSLTPEELTSIKNSAGLQYQWGRKDPIPSFRNPGDQTQNLNNKIYLSTDTYNQGNLVYTDVDENYYNANFNMSGLANAAYISNNIALNSKFGIKSAIESVLLASVQNPLSILTNPGTKDWVFANDAYASDRWGHGTSKSVFDPCPDGWRVPDVLSTESDASVRKTSSGNAAPRGTSPWYYGNYSGGGFDYPYGVPQRAIDLTGVYSGIIAYSSTSHLLSDPVYGYMFNNPNYKIGNFPSTGIRNKDGNNGIFSSGIATDVWTSALASRSKGVALAMQIGHTNNYIHNRRMNALSSGNEGVDDAIPQSAANVRCVKDMPRYDGTIPPTPVTDKQMNRVTAKNIAISLSESQRLYPNPVRDILYINTEKDTTYKIYDMTGILVLSGKFVDKQINIAHLKEGVYMIQLNDETVFKIIKQKF